MDEPREEAPQDAGPEETPRELDLLTVGLVVFFVALIGVVAAMLILTIR